jgi:hypothetical protein
MQELREVVPRDVSTSSRTLRSLWVVSLIRLGQASGSARTVVSSANWNQLNGTWDLYMNKGVKRLSTILFFLLTFHLGISGIASAEAPKNSVARSGFVTSWDGAKIHYLEAGKISITGSHPPASILFVPRFTMPAWIRENQIAHFSASYHVVAMDLRSQVESSKTDEGHYPASQARDIKAVIDQLDLKPVVLVGWSMAVTEIASYVEQFGTSVVSGIVLVDGIAGLDLTPDVIKSSFDFLKTMQTNRSEERCVESEK